MGATVGRGGRGCQRRSRPARIGQQPLFILGSFGQQGAPLWQILARHHRYICRAEDVADRLGQRHAARTCDERACETHLAEPSPVSRGRPDPVSTGLRLHQLMTALSLPVRRSVCFFFAAYDCRCRWVPRRFGCHGRMDALRDHRAACAISASLPVHHKRNGQWRGFSLCGTAPSSPSMPTLFPRSRGLGSPTRGPIPSQHGQLTMRPGERAATFTRSWRGRAGAG